MGGSQLVDVASERPRAISQRPVCRADPRAWPSRPPDKPAAGTGSRGVQPAPGYRAGRLPPVQQHHPSLSRQVARVRASATSSAYFGLCHSRRGYPAIREAKPGAVRRHRPHRHRRQAQAWKRCRSKFVSHGIVDSTSKWDKAGRPRERGSWDVAGWRGDDWQPGPGSPQWHSTWIRTAGTLVDGPWGVRRSVDQVSQQSQPWITGRPTTGSRTSPLPLAKGFPTGSGRCHKGHLNADQRNHKRTTGGDASPAASLSRRARQVSRRRRPYHD